MGAVIPPHVIRKIYSGLTGDASAEQNPGIDRRVRQAIIGDDLDLVIDLRHLNMARPGDTFQVFLGALEKKVVRGKNAVAPANTILGALDDDANVKGSLTPSVCLDVDIPETLDSFYRRNVAVVLKDAAFQPSNHFHHAKCV